MRPDTHAPTARFALPHGATASQRDRAKRDYPSIPGNAEVSLLGSVPAAILGSHLRAVSRRTSYGDMPRHATHLNTGKRKGLKERMSGPWYSRGELVLTYGN